MSRTLRPEDRIAHYKVVSALAAGGMGEVYLAQDQKLERSVALKILPPDLVKDRDRVQRFEREAKSASSLSHPNIVTIYEIGQGPLESEGEDASSEPIHFISMELVTGDTLRDKIHTEKTDLKTLLGYLSQAAEGIAKAHAAGIVHRDLKPSNIMVSADGYAKVLDFGLAKLTERQEPGEDMTAAATVLPDATEDGVVMGTVGYMSPEQVRGKAVDARSDIFSFGCILYEAVARQRPFQADSNVETMHKILHDAPEPVEELNPDAPREVRRLIKRCLTRNPEQRLQSMKDLAIELRDIVDEYDTLSPSGFSGATAVDPGTGSGLHAQVGGRRVPPLALAGIIVLGLAGLIFGAVSLFTGSGGDGAETARLATTSIVSGSELSDILALSPDGKYLAYTRFEENDRSILAVRQLATGSDVTLVTAPYRNAPSNPTFSPDGNYLYYTQRDPESPNYSAVFEIPFLGGTPRKRLFDVDTPLAFSPDGTRVVFRRGMPQNDQDALILATLDTGEEEALIVTRQGDVNRPQWTSDGRWIVVNRFESVGRAGLARVSVETGEYEPIPGAWIFLGEFGVLPGDREVVAVGMMPSVSGAQIYRVPLDGGEPLRMTHDTNSYQSVAVSADGSTLVAHRESRGSNLWSLDLEPGAEPRRLSQGSGRSGSVFDIAPLPGGEVVASVSTGETGHLFALQPDGSRRQLTSGPSANWDPMWIPGTEAVLFNRFAEDTGVNVWRIDADGGGLHRLTTGELGEEHESWFVQNGQEFLFTTIEPDPRLYRMPVDGGEATLVHGSVAILSPDETLLLAYEFREEEGGRSRGHWVARRVDTGDEVFAYPIGWVSGFVGERSGPQWTPDSRAITATLRSADGRGGLVRLPVDGSEPVPLVEMELPRIVVAHQWSPDGNTIMMMVRQGPVANLYAADPDGSNLRAVTDFRTGQVFRVAWSPDGGRLYFTHGEVEEDLVLARDFR